MVLSDAGQECRIWNAKPIDSQRWVPPPQPNAWPLGDTDTQEEFSFYDALGRATAYLDFSDGLVFYLWTGEPVAYLDGDSIYGFNGKHLGWYHNGLVYDEDGNVVCAPAAAFREPPNPGPIRSLKQLKPLKGLKELKPLKPLFGRAWSRLPARVFFLMGVN
ncbi:MAG TPA: hypothetical protein VF226_12140 [Hyphomicrobiaceae bacterium]